MTLPKGRRRARSAEEKAGRETDFVAAARRALETMDYDEVTVAHVATRAGLTKASAYLYFPTKESLFLRVTEIELDAWFRTLEGALKKTRPAAIPALIARTLSGAPVLLQLLTLLHGRIERNLTLAEIARFKAFLAGALKASRPRPRYTVTASASLLLFMRRWMSDRAWDNFLKGNFPQPGKS